MDKGTAAVIAYTTDKMLKIMETSYENQSIVNDRMLTNLEKTVNWLNQTTEVIKMLTKRVQELETKVEELTKEPNIEELCNNVIVAADQGGDDFMSAYLELTDALKAEVQQDIKNEKDII